MKCAEFESKHLYKAVVAELDRIRDNLREKGDHYRASKVEQFKQEYFVEPTSSVTDKVPTMQPPQYSFPLYGYSECGFLLHKFDIFAAKFRGKRTARIVCIPK